MNELIPPSGYYYPNKMGRLYLAALEEAVQKNGLNALLNWSQMSHYIERRPPDNWERAFDFADIANLNLGLRTLYGPRGGQRLAVRNGRYFFENGLKQLGLIAGLGDLALRTLPINAKLKMGLLALARIFTQFSDQISRLEETGTQFMFHVENCPICLGQSAAKPLCYFTSGVLQEAVTWFSGGQSYRVEEVQCRAGGDRQCAYKIDKEPIR